MYKLVSVSRICSVNVGNECISHLTTKRGTQHILCKRQFSCLPTLPPSLICDCLKMAMAKIQTSNWCHTNIRWSSCPSIGCQQSVQFFIGFGSITLQIEIFCSCTIFVFFFLYSSFFFLGTCGVLVATFLYGKPERSQAAEVKPV